MPKYRSFTVRGHLYRTKLPPVAVGPPILNPYPQSRDVLPSIIDLYKEPLDALVTIVKNRCFSSSFRHHRRIFNYTIDRLAQHKRFSAVEDIVKTHKTISDITVEGFTIRLIEMYGRAGMFQHAHNLFDEMPRLKCKRTVVSFTFLLGAALDSKEFKRVVEIFRDYPSQLGIEPSLNSYNFVIKALCQLGSVDEAIAMVDELMEKDLKPDLTTFNSLVEGAYSKKGVAEGDKVWSLMCDKNSDLVPDVKSYNAKLNGLVIEKMVTEAVELYHKMSRKALKPDEFTYNAIIKGFCDKGDVEEAKKWYGKLVEGELLPNWTTFEILAPVLCENGDTDLAFDLSKNMFERHFMVDEGLLQRVVDKLVQDSKVDRAKKLVEMGQQNYYCQYNLVMPSV